MEEKKLNERESLELITRMISDTREKMERGSSIPFLIWGYTTVAVSILIWYLLSTTGNYRWNFLWFAIPMISYPMMLAFTGKKNKSTKSYIDKVISYIWIGVGIAGLIPCVAAFFTEIHILFFIIILMGAGTAITGLVLNHKVLCIAGFGAILLSPICLLFFQRGVSILIFAAIFLLMMVIPGHIMNWKRRKHV